jgi:hypothetical protein
MLKLSLEEALLEFRNKIPLIIELDFDSPRFAQDNQKNIDTMERRTNNCLLVQYYAEGIHCHKWGLKPKNRNQVIGCFLDEYFKDEPMALHHLNEVTPYLIQRVSASKRTSIIQEKPALVPEPILATVFTKSPKTTSYEEYPFELAPIIEGNIQGPNDLETGEMW